VSGSCFFVLSITLEPEKLQRFAQSEVGILLTGFQLKNLPQFTDADICQAGAMLRDALISRDIGSDPRRFAPNETGPWVGFPFTADNHHGQLIVAPEFHISRFFYITLIGHFSLHSSMHTFM
jgi:hypothetical protein